MEKPVGFEVDLKSQDRNTLAIKCSSLCGGCVAVYIVPIMESGTFMEERFIPGEITLVWFALEQMLVECMRQYMCSLS